MPKVQIDPFEFHRWQGHRITCGPLRLVLTPSIGGRIMSVRFEGKELLYVQKEHAGETFDFTGVEDLNARKKEMGFRFWGGDKTWVSPQSMWQEGIPPLELDAAPYALTWEDQQAVMTSPVCRETGLRIVRRVRVDENWTVHLAEEFHNTTDKPIRRGVWNVTQVLRPAVFFVPAAKGAFRSYHEEDKTLPEAKNIFSENDGWVEIPCRQNTLFKCGGIPKEGHVLVKVPLGGPREVVWLKSFKLESDVTYAHNAAVEVFNSGTHNYAELELHAPLFDLSPGAFCRMEQQWKFKKI